MVIPRERRGSRSGFRQGIEGKGGGWGHLSMFYMDVEGRV